MEYGFIFDVALILATTKILGMATRRVKLPQVVGALLAGLILGPACLGILHETEFINQLAELGVIVLMFDAGLETDINELKKSGKNSFIVATLGVIVPFVGGFLVAQAYGLGTTDVLRSVFIGLILTATSVSISVETLKEMGRLSTPSGNIILGAALIDDILGVILLTVVTSFADPNVNIAMMAFKIIAFFALSGVVGFLLHKGFQVWMQRHDRDLRRFAVFSFAFCLLYSFIAEEFFGVADITGAFLAGLIISNTSRATYVSSRVGILSYMLLSPLFFANIGLKVVLPQMNFMIVSFTIIICIVAILSKVIGCGLGAKLCRCPNTRALPVGVGMISRGEVALIIAMKGIALGMMDEQFIAPVILMVVVTTVITPILLKFVYNPKYDTVEYQSSKLVDSYEKSKDFERASQALLRQHDQVNTENK
ncbi:cation:proton antiporter [Amedibacterium intestinale]|uniref:cation:proton antiporter n=1 Tax=Amedibacterium intestinale TaxID=2583452 RepID=UPI0022E53F27|nr:cation:proton antiporter [Amedibacterium intestinale]